MWPWGHAAFGYLLARASLPVEDARQWSLVALLFGTQFPDLVDKPLAWTFAVLPTGRSLAHSLLTLAVVVALAYAVASRYGRGRQAIAFGVGAVSHALADGLHAAATLEFADLSYLLWPLLPSPEYDTDPSFAAHLANLELSASLALEFALVAVALAVFLWTERVERAT